MVFPVDMYRNQNYWRWSERNAKYYFGYD